MKIALEVFGILLAIAAVACGVMGMTDVMAVSAILAVVLLFVGNLDRIARIRATLNGFEAETRAVIQEARATIEQARLIAKLAVQANLALVMRAGRWGGFSSEEKDKTLTENLAALTHLGISQKDQEEMLKDWHTCTMFDYWHLLLGRHTIPKQIQNHQELIAEWKSLRHGGFANIPSSTTVGAFLKKANMIDAAANELLADYKHYEQHQQHRRPTVWKNLVDQDR